MEIHYRERNGKAEIVRCFGRDPHVEIPDTIEGLPVAGAAPYAFSARKEREDTDVCISQSGIFAERGELLAGEAVESVCFPDSMEEIGKYIFYGCRNLKKLVFSDRLTGIGSGAFTGCRSLEYLEVHLTEGETTRVKEILGDLWQRIDVEFIKDGEKSYLVFPEHYEEAVENTPARILFTQHHGSGNNYRQCFYDRKTDYRKYDALFTVARAWDKTDVLSDIALGRLMYPVQLTEEAREAYEDYFREHGVQAGEYLTEKEDLAAMRELSARGLWSEEALSAAIDYAAHNGKRETLGFLMEEKHRLFPVRRKKFDL